MTGGPQRQIFNSDVCLVFYLLSSLNVFCSNLERTAWLVGKIIKMQSGSYCPVGISRATSKMVNISKAWLITDSKTPEWNQYGSLLLTQTFLSLLSKTALRISPLIKQGNERGLAGCSSQRFFVSQWGTLMLAAAMLFANWAQTKMNY